VAKKRNSKRNSKAKTFKNKAVPTPPPSPPPSAPRQVVARTGLPPRSARARAALWDKAASSETGNRGLWDVLTPTTEQAAERDEELASRPDVVQMDPMEWWALEMARQGNATHLFTYDPTNSSFRPRPRTIAAGYQESTYTLRIRFRNGRVYGYYRVPPNVWRNFKATNSPGKYINRVLNHYDYSPEPDLDQPTGRS
jgi:hypothetical protein